MMQQQPAFERTLADYFRKRLIETSEQLTPPPHEDTLWYTGSMLARFGRSREVFSFESGEVTLRPLAMLYQDAHEAMDERERCLILRQLGDLALFLGALFPENYQRRGIGKDYFVGMGGGAYDYLSENANSHRHVFQELANTFTRMLELIASVCARQNCFDSRDIINLYRRWQQTGNPAIASQLQAMGIDVSSESIQH